MRLLRVRMGLKGLFSDIYRHDAMTLELCVQQLPDLLQSFPEVRIVGLQGPVEIIHHFEEVNCKTFICQGNDGVTFPLMCAV